MRKREGPIHTMLIDRQSRVNQEHFGATAAVQKAVVTGITDNGSVEITQ
jgi:hypothetical protein